MHPLPIGEKMYCRKIRLPATQQSIHDQNGRNNNRPYRWPCSSCSERNGSYMLSFPDDALVYGNFSRIATGKLHKIFPINVVGYFVYLARSLS